MDTQTLTPENTTAIKVIVIKTKFNKALIGFSSKPEEFLNDLMKNRPQYSKLTAVNPRHYTAQLDDSSELTNFYITSLRDGETCWVSLNENCMGFNDFH